MSSSVRRRARPWRSSLALPGSQARAARRQRSHVRDQRGRDRRSHRGRDRDRRPRRRDPAEIDALGAKYGVSMRPEQRLEPHARQARGRRRRPRARGRASSTRSSHDPRVEHAEPMAVYRATFVPDDPLYASKQWHLQRVGAEKRVGATPAGRASRSPSSTRASPASTRGPSRAGPTSRARAARAAGTSSTTRAEAYDDQGHGTHVAGTIAQTTNNGSGRGGPGVLRHAHARQGPQQAGLRDASPTSPRGSASRPTTARRSSTCRSAGRSRAASSKDAVDHALSKGVVVVAAAGNSGKKVGWPAAYPGVVAVSATDDNDKIAWFSSRGPEVAIAAPGVGVTQQTVCNGGRDKCEIFGTFNGTSMASPHVAGVAAMIESLGVTRGRRRPRRALRRARAPAGGAIRSSTAPASSTRGAAASHVFWSHFVASRARAARRSAWLVAPPHRQARRHVRALARRRPRGAASPASGLLPVRRRSPGS